MAKFCTKCGTPTDENGACPNCPAAAPVATPVVEPVVAPTAVPVAEPAAAPTVAPVVEPTAAPVAAPVAEPAAAPVDADTSTSSTDNQYAAMIQTAVDQAGPFLESYCKAPMEATAEMASGKNIPLAAGFMAIYALISGLLIFSIYFTVVSEVGNMFSAFSSSFDLGLSAPILPMFAAGIAIAIVALVLTVGVVFLVLQLCKVNADWKGVVTAVGCNTVALTLCLALAVGFIFVGLYMVAAVFIGLNIVLWILLIILIPNQVFGATYNGVAILAGAVAIAVAICLTAMVAGKMNIYAISSIETAAGSLGEIAGSTIDALGDFSVTDIMSDMVMDMFY